MNDQKGFFHDFSSGNHGDIFDFVMATEGVTFPEAVERLAALAGVPMPKFSREDEAREEKRKTLHDVMELAAKFFEATLAARAGAKARGYLADRGSIRRRSSSSASATRRPSVSRLRNSSASRACRSKTWLRPGC